MSDWQPIETAPKDGLRILLADLAENIEIGAWNLSYNQWMDDSEAGWVNSNWATHWMHLPPPPE